MQRRACIASRMLSSSVVSPRQTLRKLAKRPRVTAKTKPSPSISDTTHAFTYACASQCAEGLHFSAFHINHVSVHKLLVDLSQEGKRKNQLLLKV